MKIADLRKERLAFSILPVIATLLLSACVSMTDMADEGDIANLAYSLQAGESPDSRDAAGTTPLMVAAGEGRIDMIRILLQYNATIDLKNHAGKTALDIARENDQFAAFKLLMEKGANTSRYRANADDKAADRYTELVREYRTVRRIATTPSDIPLREFDAYFSFHANGAYAEQMAELLEDNLKKDYSALGEPPDPGKAAAFVRKYGEFGKNLFIIDANLLNIRQSPTAASARAGAYKRSEIVYALQKEGNWLKTDRGWISRQYARNVHRHVPVVSEYLEKAKAIAGAPRPEPVRRRSAVPPKRRTERSADTLPETPSTAMDDPPIPPEVAEEPVPPEEAAPSTVAEGPPMLPTVREKAALELETIRKSPTLPALEAFILKYKDKPGMSRLVESARGLYKTLLLGN